MTLARPVAMQKITIAMPPELLDRLDQSARELGTSRSQLICEVLGVYLEEKRQQELKDRLEEGYRVHAARDLRISEAFRFADYEATVQAVPPYELKAEDEWHLDANEMRKVDEAVKVSLGLL